MSTIDRRTFMRGIAAIGGIAAIRGLPVHAAPMGDSGISWALRQLSNRGELVPTPANNTGEVLLALPRGFQYNVFGKTGSTMADSRLTPRAHDGMASFSVGGKIRLVRNHEIGSRVTAPLGDPALAYDPLAGGGTTTLEIDPVSRDLVASWVSLSGTIRNCAGGETPWGSWISCEETNVGPRRGFTKIHGYNFEVPAAATGEVIAEPLPAMGLFYHEAVAVDPATGIVYQTEDLDPSGIYRFVPDTPGSLKAGKLQMLAVAGKPGYDTRTGQKANQVLPISWVDIADPNPVATYETDVLAVYKQGLALGGATFSRGEGMWYANGNIYFACSSGGDLGLGQIWELRVRGRLAGTMRMMYESTGSDVLDSPDNITVSPRGGFIVICEDGDGDQYVRILTRDGSQIVNFAKNIVPGFETREFAGATFSSDGDTLFVNIQTPGLTFAIWGAW
jgi:hypothetical protein